MTPADDMPLVVALNGSERPDGATAEVIRHCRGVFEEHSIRLESISLADLRLTPCGPCGDCNVRRSTCDVDDDVASVVATMMQADGLLYAMPVHGFGTPSLMQIFIERAGVGYLRFRRPLANKVGGVVVVGRRYSHTEVVSHVQQNMLLNRMLLVGSGFPAVVHTHGRSSVLEDVEGIAATESMVSRMAQMIWLLRRSSIATSALRLPTANERVR